MVGHFSGMKKAPGSVPSPANINAHDQFMHRDTYVRDHCVNGGFQGETRKLCFHLTPTVKSLVIDGDSGIPPFGRVLPISR